MLIQSDDCVHIIYIHTSLGRTYDRDCSFRQDGIVAVDYDKEEKKISNYLSSSQFARHYTLHIEPQLCVFLFCQYVL